MALDTSHLSPADAAVAARSLARRFRATLWHPDADREPGDADDDELARRIGPDGTSAIQRLAAADGLFDLAARSIDAVRRSSHPTVHPALVDPAERVWSDDHSPLDHQLDQFDATAAALADAIEAMAPDDWNLEIPVAGRDTRRTAIDVVRGVVADVSDGLRAAQATLAAVRD